MRQFGSPKSPAPQRGGHYVQNQPKRTDPDFSMSPPCGNSDRCTCGWSNCPATYVIDDHCTTVASILATIPNRLDGSLHFYNQRLFFCFCLRPFASSQQNNSAAIASTCFALLYRLSQSAVQPPLWQAVQRADFAVPVSASAPALRRGGC